MGSIVVSCFLLLSGLCAFADGSALGCLAEIFPEETWVQLGTFGDAFRIAHMTCVALGHSAETCQEVTGQPFERFSKRMAGPIQVDERLCGDLTAAFAKVISSATTLPVAVADKIQSSQQQVGRSFLERSKRCVSAGLDCEAYRKGQRYAAHWDYFDPKLFRKQKDVAGLMDLCAEGALLEGSGASSVASASEACYDVCGAVPLTRQWSDCSDRREVYFSVGSYDHHPREEKSYHHSILATLRRNRLATLLFYLSNTSKGGATAFPMAYGASRPLDPEDCEPWLQVPASKGQGLQAKRRSCWHSLTRL
ncbi:unnamed protein product [Effrenium voratum]|nr:unnamed protein product [Effrenium voratum]